ncbi:MAG: universal stress protein [Bacteroidales bacterium]|jgi:nucleotide-binding universal stress UspA family protein|nr:universal stress protein [Bacteroidales bacterium]
MSQNIKDRNNIILVPTDFTPVGQNAIDHAVKVGEILKFKVVILHVINRETKSSYGKESASFVVDKKLHDIVSEIKSRSKVKVEYLFREGSIFDVIHEVASELKVNMMILGTHGKKGLQHLVGSYAMRVITQSPVPVIVVQKRHISDHGYKKIVFPIGLYTESRQQVFHAIVSSLLFKSEILVFKQTSKEIADSSKLNIITSQIEEEFTRNNVKFTVTEAERHANFAGQLLDFAVSESADLLMMMTDSNIENPSFDNSSWSEKLIFNLAQIPVLSINPVYLGQIYFTL